MKTGYLIVHGVNWVISHSWIVTDSGQRIDPTLGQLNEDLAPEDGVPAIGVDVTTTSRGRPIEYRVSTSYGTLEFD